MRRVQEGEELEILGTEPTGRWENCRWFLKSECLGDSSVHFWNNMGPGKMLKLRQPGMF